MFHQVIQNFDFINYNYHFIKVVFSRFYQCQFIFPKIYLINSLEEHSWRLYKCLIFILSNFQLKCGTLFIILLHLFQSLRYPYLDHSPWNHYESFNGLCIILTLFILSSFLSFPFLFFILSYPSLLFPSLSSHVFFIRDKVLQNCLVWPLIYRISNPSASPSQKLRI